MELDQNGQQEGGYERTVLCPAPGKLFRGRLDGPKMLIGAALCALGIAAAYLHYTKKDIH